MHYVNRLLRDLFDIDLIFWIINYSIWSSLVQIKATTGNRNNTDK